MLKLLIAILIAGCGNGDQCAVNTACSPGSLNHYQFCHGASSADDCYYITGDGRSFHCVTCGDCSGAKSLVASWCASQPTGPTTSSNLTCTKALCPNGTRSYSFCSSPGAGKCTYQGTDGSTFDCNSCSDCSNAAQRIVDWCNGVSSSSSGGTASDSTCLAQATSACQTCCADNHANGANYFADGYTTCGCGYCTSACSTAGDVCHGGSTQTSDCASCLSNAFQQSCAQQVESSCASDAACSGYLSCVQRC
jgi:hypothetical protein